VTGDLRAQLQGSLGTAYHLERELGGGGMSRVFLATDTTLGRRVVVKVLSPELAEGLSAERFVREMKLAAALQDPHIVPLLVSGESDGLPYFTMPYVEGESLRARLLRTDAPLAFHEILGILRDVALALEYAHARGVVHRDIKPENVLLAGRTAVVADFGIAKALSAARTQASGNSSGTLTSAGTSLGTPAYMAPEQAAGDPTDHRADLYAWGMMAYEMLAGRHPFAAKTTVQALITAQMVEMPPSLLKEKPGLPPPLAGIVMQCLAKEAAGRPHSAAELLQALDGIATPGSRTRPSAPAKATSGGRARLVVGALVVAALLAGGYLVGHRGPAGASATSSRKRVAVLPFENLGDTTDAYFADGVANEVRTKLTALPSMQVTARASSMAYKGSTKPPGEIARELGVDYLLTGTVQWQKGAGGNRVHVTPELIQASTGTSTWQQAFDAALTDVFKVQADIAGQVASALGVAIGAGDQQRLAERPTQNLSAYDAFLRGEAASQGLSVSQPAALRQAIDAYEQAVALDSTFVQAWAQLSRANSRIYQIGTSDVSAAARARQTAERALALAPNRPEGHQALGQYYLDVVSDNAKGFTEDSIALAILPSNAELMATTARSEYHLGRWEQARQRLEEAARLDPRSIFTADHLGRVLLYTRRQDEARRAIDRAMQISPGNFGVREFGIMAWLAEGNLARARAELAEGTKFGEPTGIVAYVATYYDLIWLLDDAQQQLLVRLTPSAFDNDRATWATVLAQTYALRGDQARTRIYADSAQLTYVEQLKQNPNDPQLHVLRGLALAYLGRKAEAVSEGELARRLLPIDRDEYTGGYVQHQFVRILMVNGDHERAIDMLEPLLHRPYFLTPAWLRIDPNFKPLKGNPRFERLAAGS
jgi:serine/threonine-protein kinase